MIVNCPKTKCMIVSKRDNPRCELHIGDVKIQKVEKLNNSSIVVTDKRKGK